MIFVHEFAKCMEAIEFGPSLSEVLRLTEHMWPENVFSFTEGKQISWIQLYGIGIA